MSMTRNDDVFQSKLFVGDALRLRLEGRIAEELELARVLLEEDDTREALQCVELAQRLVDKLQNIQKEKST